MQPFDDYKKLIDRVKNRIITLEESERRGTTRLDDLSSTINTVEKLAVQIRGYSKYYVGENFEKADEVVEKCMMDQFKITYEYFDNDFILLHMPRLASKKRLRERRYLGDILSNITKDIKEKYQPIKKEDRFVLIVHNISKEKIEMQLATDYDNEDIPALINALTEIILINDSPFYYNLMHYYREIPVGQDASTDIYILSRENFKKWMEVNIQI